MAYDNYQLLKIKKDEGVVFATIDNPPINLMTMDLVAELLFLSIEIKSDPDARVIVFDSSNEDYFIAHYDVTVLSLFPEIPPPKSTDLHDLNKVCEAFRRMPKISMAKIEGRARGGGSEFCMGLDMRFAAKGKALLSQPEVGLGIIPGGGGTQRLPRLVGSARALEIILGGHDLTAEEAETYGYVNRSLPPAELDAYVNDLAYRIASWPSETTAAAKKAVLAAGEMPLLEGLSEESYLFGQTAALPEAKTRMKNFLEKGGQTYDGELDLRALLRRLNNS